MDGNGGARGAPAQTAYEKSLMAIRADAQERVSSVSAQKGATQVRYVQRGSDAAYLRWVGRLSRFPWSLPSDAKYRVVKKIRSYSSRSGPRRERFY